MSRGVRGLGLFEVEHARWALTAVVMLLGVALALAVLDGPQGRAAAFSGVSGDADSAAGSASDARAEGPDALIVPSIGLDASMVDIAVDGGVLTPPSDYTEVGYWGASAAPGSARGQTVVTGHTVHTGGGVMDELGNVADGDPLQVRYDDRLVDYRVTSVATLSKAEVAERATELFGQDTRRGRLVLVSCTDWNGTDYDSNVVVFADRTDVA